MIQRVTGLNELIKLMNDLPIRIATGIGHIQQGIASEALGVFSANTPVDTEALLDTEDVTVTETETIIFADKDYGVYQDRGFKHYRNGKIPAKNFTGKTVDRIEGKYVDRINQLLEREIRKALGRR